MKQTPVEHLDTPQLQIYRTLRDNQTTQDNSFIADSPKVVNMLLHRGIEARSLLATESYYRANEALLKSREVLTCYVAPKAVIETIIGHKIHHNVMMHGVRPPQQSIDELGDRIIMLDELSKTDNVGAIARSAAALGIDSLIAPSRGPHPYGRRALRVSMGYISQLKLHIYDDIHQTMCELKKLGYSIFAAEVTPDAIPLSKAVVPDKWVLLMGHEQRGISAEILKLCDEIVQIEMEPEIKSFNVAIAASILMYQFKMKTTGNF
ncbi:MAG: TrmH family RNA methyltransferase [Campylobacterota bacterium]|nr:TrmH family RNA methyltransferase [Campylobacterota bacterium]